MSVFVPKTCVTKKCKKLLQPPPRPQHRKVRNTSNIFGTRLNNCKMNYYLYIIIDSNYSILISGGGLECYFCQSDDHHNLEECNAEHAGGIVSCQNNDSEAPHFGTYCNVGHTGMFSKYLETFLKCSNH